MEKSPLYIKIARELQKMIDNKNFDNTNMIPPEMVLTKMFNASRVTIRKAIDILVEERVLEKKHGSGTFIKSKQVAYDPFKLKSFKEEMEGLGYEYTSEVIDFRIVKATSEIANFLKIKENEKVYYIKRVRSIGDEPATLEISYLPLKLFSDLTYSDMEKSKFEYVEIRKGLKISRTDSNVEALIPSSDVKRLLQLPDNLPILNTKGISYLEGDIPFDYTEIFFNPKNYQFKLSSLR